MASRPDREPFVLRAGGRELRVEQREAGLRTALTLLVDGEPRAERRTTSDVTLEADGLAVRVDVDWRGRIRRCLLVDGEERIPFDPPPGSRAARRVALQREHPVRYTLQEAGRATAGVLIPLLGIGALLRLLLPKVDLPEVDLPDLTPDIDLPDLIPDVDLPRIDLPGWLDALLASGRYWIPVAIAVALAVGEIRRQRHKQERERAAREAADAAPTPPPAPDREPEPDRDQAASR
ncbi:hypothetical protein [Patulibacter defluvii]|uniref:hypothetical protein n=1 Tax=Patulibacter defluvii TaxID=3095358 RepID=UPI002A74E149|nr:hypothetical protein [Patulibacter sp. DM4]